MKKPEQIINAFLILKSSPINKFEHMSRTRNKNMPAKANGQYDGDYY